MQRYPGDQTTYVVDVDRYLDHVPSIIFLGSSGTNGSGSATIFSPVVVGYDRRNPQEESALVPQTD